MSDDLSKVKSLLAEEMPDEAMKILTKFLKSNPNNAQGFMLRGKTYSQMDEPKKAINDFTKALQLDNKNQEAYVYRGYAYIEELKIDEALADFAEAIKLKVSQDIYRTHLQSDDTNVYYGRALAYEQREEFDKAIEDYNKIISLDPKHSQALLGRATIYIKHKSEAEKGIKDLDSILASDPENVDTYIARASAYEEQGLFDKAIEDYTKVIELDDEDKDNFLNRANAYMESAQYDKALEDVKTAIAMDPDETAYITLGIIHDRKQDLEEAAKAYTEAIKVAEDSANAYTNRGDAYNKMGKYAEGLADLTKAIEIGAEPEDPNMYANRAFSYAQLGQFKEAEADISKLLQDNPTYHFAQGVVAALQKKPSDHFKRFEEMVATQQNAYWFELKVAKELSELSSDKEKGNKKTESKENTTQKKKKM